MTFYHILFAILFFGGIRELVRSLSHGDWLHFWEAAILCVLVFSDAIYTSEVVEGKRKPYRLIMKFLDLFSFFLLGVALLAINTGEGNLLDIITPDFLWGSNEIWFWTLLSAYWVMLILWNLLGQMYKGIENALLARVQFLMLGLFLLMLALAWSDPNGDLPRFGRPFLLICCILYFCGYKPYLLCKMGPWTDLDALSLREITTSDAVTISTWPDYPGRLHDLSYALRPGGWLDTFPAGPENSRFGAWLGCELIGFSILTKTGDGGAEFYIALRADKTHHGIGRVLTNRILQIGFNQLQLRRIHLKVRAWHSGAIELYEDVGFRRIGEKDEVIHGVTVHFVLMDVMFDEYASLYRRLGFPKRRRIA